MLLEVIAHWSDWCLDPSTLQSNARFNDAAYAKYVADTFWNSFKLLSIVKVQNDISYKHLFPISCARQSFVSFTPLYSYKFTIYSERNNDEAHR